MGHSHRIKPSFRTAGVLAGAVLVGVLIAPGPARAGFLDFLFGGGSPQRYSPPPGVSAYAEPGPPTVRRSPDHPHRIGGRGRIAFCVRLCDGQHFPIDQRANATPLETCQAMCAASKTKLFFGSEIDHAVAKDGTRYADLDNAYVYRDHLVADCKCNGKDARGLAPVDVKSDPTLRPGDIVVTDRGYVAYAGKRGTQSAEFTPVDPSAISEPAIAKSSRVRLSRRAEPPADDDPGVIVQPASRVNADLRGQLR